MDPHIATRAGERVNVLVPHEEYAVRYRVRFEKPGRDVVFGTLVRTMQGVELCSTTEPRLTQPIPHISAGTEYDVVLRFACCLMPGTYFANVGVFATSDGVAGYLHRLVDALAFRVLHGHSRSRGGLVDMFVGTQAAALPTSVKDAA